MLRRWEQLLLVPPGPNGIEDDPYREEGSARREKETLGMTYSSFASGYILLDLGSAMVDALLTRLELSDLLRSLWAVR
jgi:hypothetical protein